MKIDVKKSRKCNFAPADSFKPGDLVSIVLIIFTAVALIFFFRSGIGETGKKYAEISVLGKDADNIYIYPIERDKVLEIESSGYHFTIQILDSKVSVIQSECPDGICRNTPAISSVRESIICVPAKMIIKIVSEYKDDYDYVAY